MRLRHSLLTALAVLALAPAVSAQSLVAPLAGANEVPAVETDARGTAVAVIGADGVTVTVTGGFSGLESDYNTSIGSHLHRGAAGANGPVFQPLTPTLSDDLRSGTFRAEDNTYTLRPSLVDSLRAGLVYVNVHTVDDPGGEVRGQLRVAEPFGTALRGANEVPPVMTDAGGRATALLTGTTVVVTGSFSGLESDYNTSVGSHLHRGAADANGPVFQPLAPDLADDLRSGTFRPEDNTYTLRQSLVDSLRAGLVYVNVHTVGNPGGEVRGQLRATETFVTTLASENQVPPVDAPGTGAVAVDLSGTDLVVTGSFSGLGSDYNTDIGAHIHRGGPDENGPIFVPLNPDLADDLRSGTFDPDDNTFTISESLADSVRAGLAYVNVHTVANPGGAIRGQLRPRGASAMGAVVINEVDSDTPGTDAAEFVELYNGGTESASLDGTVLVLFNGADDANGSYRTIALSGAVPAGGYFVVCGMGSAVANCDLQATASTNLLQNGPDAVALYRRADADFPNGTAPTTDGLLDVVVYGTGDDDDRDLLDAFGAAAQVDEAAGGASDAESIQRSPDGSDTFATAAPTPGAANVGTPVSGEAGPAEPALALRVASPLRGSATVRFETGAVGPARLEVFDLLGRRVAVLVDGPVTAGPQTATLDASQLASGTYVVRLTGGAAAVARTVTVVR